MTSGRRRAASTTQPTCSRRRATSLRRDVDMPAVRAGRAGSQRDRGGRAIGAAPRSTPACAAPPSSAEQRGPRGSTRRAPAPGRRRARSAWRPRWTACAGGTSGRRRPGRSARPRSRGRWTPRRSRWWRRPSRRPVRSGPVSSVISTSSGSQVAVDVVQGLEPLPRLGAAHDDRPVRAVSGRRRAAAGRVSSIT